MLLEASKDCHYLKRSDGDFKGEIWANSGNNFGPHGESVCAGDRSSHLRLVYDKIKVNVRGLEALGVLNDPVTDQSQEYKLTAFGFLQLHF